MDQQVQISGSGANPPPPEEFASLPLARAYIDSVRDSIGSLDARELAAALERLDRAYNEFPELVLDRPRRELLRDFRSAATNMPNRAAIPLLMYCVALAPSCSSCVTSLFERLVEADGRPSPSRVVHLLRRSGECRWDAIEPMVSVLRRLGRAQTILEILSEALDGLKLAKDEDASDLGDILTCLLRDTHSPATDGRALVEAARSARRRLSRPLPGRNEQATREALLAMAERLGATPSPPRVDLRPDRVWPSGRMSFDEFLLQWPCEIELPANLDDATLIEEAYRAILLRGPDVAEAEQYLRLLRDGVVSKTWVIEDLLASKDLRSLKRRLCVIYDGQVISEPGSSGQEEMPVVTWPSRSSY